MVIAGAPPLFASIADRRAPSAASPSTNDPDVHANAIESGPISTSVSVASAASPGSATARASSMPTGSEVRRRTGDVHGHRIGHPLPVLAVEREVERHDHPDAPLPAFVAHRYTPSFSVSTRAGVPTSIASTAASGTPVCSSRGTMFAGTWA